MSTRLGSLPVSVLLTPIIVLSIRRLVSSPFQKDCRNCETNLLNTTIGISVWNLLVSIGTLYITFWRNITFGLPFLAQVQKHMKQEILRISDLYASTLNLICTMLRFNKNPMTAKQVLPKSVVICLSSPHFPFISWAGCCARNDQSNKKLKSMHKSTSSSQESNCCNLLYVPDHYLAHTFLILLSLPLCFKLQLPSLFF